MPNRRELSKAYKAGYNCAVVGPNTTNCNFTLFSSREATKMWEAGNQDAVEKLLNAQAEIDTLGTDHSRHRK